MTEILQIFSGNPFSTFIGKRVEAATRPELESDDWAINLEICDLINENDDDAKDAVRAIKKRLQQIEQDRDFTVTNRTLTVLETCVSNCSRRFHVLVMTKDFIQDLVKLIGPKNNPPIDLQERVLNMIERWADAFKSQPDLSGVVAVYNDLKAKGVTFPPRDRVPNVPIQTPQRSIPATQSNSPQAMRSNINQDAINQPTLQTQPTGPVVLEGEGYNKISQDLAVVQSSVEMFNEILQLLETKNEESDWKLAQDLNTTCRQMKSRIVDLIERVANEDLTIEFLRLNDDLNNIFTKYDRLVKNRSKASKKPAQTVATAGAGSSQADLATLSEPVAQRSSSRVENELSLIDFNADDSAGAARKEQPAIIDPFDTSNVMRTNSGNTNTAATSQTSQQPKQSRAPVESLVDPLSQLGLSGPSTKNSGAKKPSGALPEEISSVREQDFAEIENWLSTDSGRDLASISADMPSLEPISIPNSEFENFIATRALAGSSTRPAPASTSNTDTNNTNSSSRQVQRQPEPSV